MNRNSVDPSPNNPCRRCSNRSPTASSARYQEYTQHLHAHVASRFVAAVHSRLVCEGPPAGAASEGTYLPPYTVGGMNAVFAIFPRNTSLPRSSDVRQARFDYETSGRRSTAVQQERPYRPVKRDCSLGRDHHTLVCEGGTICRPCCSDAATDIDASTPLIPARGFHIINRGHGTVAKVKHHLHLLQIVPTKSLIPLAHRDLTSLLTLHKRTDSSLHDCLRCSPEQQQQQRHLT